MPSIPWSASVFDSGIWLLREREFLSPLLPLCDILIRDLETSDCYRQENLSLHLFPLTTCCITDLKISDFCRQESFSHYLFHPALRSGARFKNIWLFRRESYYLQSPLIMAACVLGANKYPYTSCRPCWSFTHHPRRGSLTLSWFIINEYWITRP